ncbi:CAP domain-containing protein [Cellulosilyticum sp. I15G10I2]|uniref:CAP domain-containing protein n=1 Tax=Cellulosilyticum sp. I15G10I2 TaxID=1892843 RepID=UPI00085CA0CB|nr:CAP domain-containing protein [Cellulosilyticum sp. I15G10I2]
MKINKKLSKLNLSLLASFVVLVGSSSVFASSASACTPSTKLNVTNFRANTGNCTTPAACKTQASCQTSASCKTQTSCNTSTSCKTSGGCKTSNNIKAPAAAVTPTEVKIPAKTTPAAPAVTTDNSALAYENKVLELVNVERQKAGLKPLQMDEAVRNVARMKSQDMQAKKYFDHNSPTYGSPFDMMKQFGISYKTAGENIAMGQKTPEEVVNAWMNSPGHRANILKPAFTHIGVGYVANGSYWTQMFIGK